MSQSPVACSRETLRASANEPFHGNDTTRAPNDSAISTVRSDEPVSTTTISSTASRAAARHAGSSSSSSFTIMHSESVSPAAGCAASATRKLRSASAPSAAAIELWPILAPEQGARRVQVRGGLGERRIEPQRCGEERGSGLDLGQLVEQDACEVEQQRLRRRALEHAEQALRRHLVEVDPAVAADRIPRREHELGEMAGGLVCALRLIPARRLGEERAHGGEVVPEHGIASPQEQLLDAQLAARGALTGGRGPLDLGRRRQRQVPQARDPLRLDRCRAEAVQHLERAPPLLLEDAPVVLDAGAVVDALADEGLAAGVVDEGVARDDAVEARGARPQAVVVVLEVACAEALVERADGVEHLAPHEQAEADEPRRGLDHARVDASPRLRERLDLGGVGIRAP